MAGAFFLFGFGAGFPGPARPERGEHAAGWPQRPLRQGAGARGGVAPSPETRLPRPGAARSLPGPSQPVGGRGARGPGTWAPPSHPPSHSHTPARCISCFFPGRQHGSSGVSRCQRAGQRRPPANPHPTPGVAVPGPAAASFRTSLAASVTAPRTRAWSPCCDCPDVEAAGRTH